MKDFEKERENIKEKEQSILEKRNEEINIVNKKVPKEKLEDKIYLILMETILVITAPFAILSILIEITLTSVTLVSLCILLTLAISIEKKAIENEKLKRLEAEKEMIKAKYEKELEELNKRKLEFLTEEEKEEIRQIKQEELRIEREKKQKEFEEEMAKTRKKIERKNKFIQIFNTIYAIAYVLNIIADILLCIICLPLGLFFCFCTAVASRSMKS